MADNSSSSPLTHEDAELLRRANAGDPQAQQKLKILHAGLLFPQGRSDDVRFAGYLRCALLGSPEGMFLAGDAYLYGGGTQVDELQALEWFRKGGVLGDRNCLHSLGLMAWNESQTMPRDYPLARSYFQQSIATRHGNSASAFMLGLMAENGQGIPADMELASSYYASAANGKYFLAKIRCSQLHAEGYDVQAHPFHITWLTIGLTEHYTEVIYVMGFACLLGQGVAQSDANALLWLTMASNSASELEHAAAACRALRVRLSEEELREVDARISRLTAGSPDERKAEAMRQFPPGDPVRWEP